MRNRVTDQVADLQTAAIGERLTHSCVVAHVVEQPPNQVSARLTGSAAGTAATRRTAGTRSGDRAADSGDNHFGQKEQQTSR